MNSIAAATVFAVERFSDCYPEASELLKAHWDEVAPYKDLLALNPDMATYESLEKSGKLHVITARNMGKLIGYIVLFVAPHHHYKDVLTAQEDIHFLHPTYRRGLVGLRLIAAAETEMRKIGVRLIALRTKVNQDHGLLFSRLGYDPQDVVYTKRIEG